MDNSHIVAQVTANVELDIDKLIDYTMKEYEIPIEEVSMDTLFEVVETSISYMKPRHGFSCSFLEEVADGPSINGFEDRTYEKIEKRLRERQGND